MYQEMIRRILGCDALRAAMVEDQMRCENGGVLDHLTKRRFASEARIADVVLTAMRDKYPEIYAIAERDARIDMPRAALTTYTVIE